jgi:hypothetical protein
MVQGGGASDQIFSRKFKYIFGTLAPASNYFGSTVNMLKALDRAGMMRRCFRAMRPGEAWDVPEQTANATNRLVDITR